MTSHAQAQTQSFTHDSLLRNTLRANSIFSALSAGLMFVATRAVADFMGIESTTPFLILGVLLLIWAADVFFVSSQNPLNKRFVSMVLNGDVLWVVGSAVILLFDPFDFSLEGKWAVLVIADIVLIFAVLQYLGLRRLQRS